MNETNGIWPSLKILHDKLDTTEGVQTEFTSASEVTVVFRGQRVANWVPDGDALIGAFACEAALLCATSADEAYRLTMGRLA